MSRVRVLRRRLKESVPAVKTVAGDPALRKEWLKSARRAQMILLTVVLVGLFVFPSFRDWLTELFFLEERGGWFRRRQRLSDTGELFGSALSFLYWFGGMGSALVALVLHAPKVAPSAKAPDPLAQTMGAGGELGVQATMAAGVGPTGTVAGSDSDLGARSSDSDSDLGSRSSDLGSRNSDLGSRSRRGTSASESRSESETASALPDAGRYRIAQELGRGGMGVVYLATDSVLEREVALKQLPRQLVTNATLAERFRTEAKALARLTHPGIVQVFDLVENDEGMFMAMELVRGGDLDQLLETRGALPVAEVARLGATMAEALGYAHAQGVIHRDFKPGNVLLADDGTPKITDFGLAKIAREGPKLTQEGAVLGSPAYMSPEQAAGGVAGPAADVYSFGVTLYEMATGRCPFEGESIASVLSAHITQPPPDPATLAEQVPPALRDLLLQMLAKTPEDRPSDLAAVAATLRAL